MERLEQQIGKRCQGPISEEWSIDSSKPQGEVDSQRDGQVQVVDGASVQRHKPEAIPEQFLVFTGAQRYSQQQRPVPDHYHAKQEHQKK